MFVSNGNALKIIGIKVDNRDEREEERAHFKK